MAEVGSEDEAKEEEISSATVEKISPEVKSPIVEIEVPEAKDVFVAIDFVVVEFMDIEGLVTLVEVVDEEDVGSGEGDGGIFTILLEKGADRFEFK